MDIGQIETFVTIARLGSFSRSAAKLHRSQPAISRRLALLEQELGTTLFERIRQRVQLTDAGRALLPHAEAALASAKGGFAAVQDQLSDGAGTASLGVVGTLVDSSLATLLTGFAASKDTPRLRVATTSSEAISELVRTGEIVLGLRYFLDEDAEIECQQIGWERMVVVSAATRRSRKENARKTQSNSATQWIGFTASKLSREGFGPLLCHQLRSASIDQPNIMAVDSLSAQKRLVEAGLGLGFLPLSSVRRELAQRTLRVIEMPLVSTRIPIALVRRRSGYLSPAAKQLKAMLTEHWAKKRA